MDWDDDYNTQGENHSSISKTRQRHEAIGSPMGYHNTRRSMVVGVTGGKSKECRRRRTPSLNDLRSHLVLGRLCLFSFRRERWRASAGSLLWWLIPVLRMRPRPSFHQNLFLWWPQIYAIALVLDSVSINQHVKYVSQRSLSSTVLSSAVIV